MTKIADADALSRAPGLRLVTVFGGGIAGLTVAHELAERGFSVQVVESAAENDDHGRPQIALGGLARTQYRRIPVPPARAEIESAARATHVPLEAHERRTASARVIELELAPTGNEDAWLPTARGQVELTELASDLCTTLASYSISIRPLVHRSSTNAPPARERWTAGADKLRELLVAAGVAHSRIKVGADGADAHSAFGPVGKTTADVGALEIRLEEAILPGEHGFRFFPAFYRHLHETLKRIPAADSETATASNGSVYERLRAVPAQLFAPVGRPASSLLRGRHSSFEAFRQELSAFLRTHGFTNRDIAHYTLRLLRYATSCTTRREREYQELSWWDFMTRFALSSAPGARSDDQPLAYSPAFLDYLRHTPRALVALDPERGDARTQGNVLIQLMRDAWLEKAPVDATLDGPASEVWFKPWRCHLEQLGVRFYAGSLLTLGEPRADSSGRLRVRPEVVPSAPEALDDFDPDADYLVIALDLVAAEQVTRELRVWGERAGYDVGVAHDVEAFALSVPDAVAGPPRRRDPETECGVWPTDRLQTLSGIQYYLGQKCRISAGYAYYTGSEWALTSIEQRGQWRRQATLSRDGHLALHSVDLGDFSARAPAPLGKAARDCTKAEIAREVWRQIQAGIAGPDGRANRLPAPLFYHVDDYLEFADGSDGPGTGRFVRNRAPYLVNVAGDWALRPRGDPWVPGGTQPNPAGSDPSRASLRPDALWQPPAGGYLVHLDQIVFAGTYLRTFTRLTTMESANESARHAVNAILAHVSSVLDVAVSTQGGGWAFRAPTAAGDYCSIWDPEREEFPELEFACDVDAHLVAAGLPHVADILELDRLPEILGANAEDPISAVLMHVADVLDRELLPENLGSENATAIRRLADVLRGFA